MENTTTRQATMEDKKEVLALNENVFDGRDYLPALYDRLISSPNTTMFILLYNKKIVAFGGCIIVDDGETAVGRASRISPEFKGLHLGVGLMYKLVDWSKARGAIRSAATEIQKGTVPIHRENHKTILSKILLAYLVNISHLNARLQQLHVPDTSHDLPIATDNNLSAYFGSKTVSSYLFPHERLLVNGIPYRLRNSNIPLISRERDITEMYTNVDQINGRCKGLLSVGTVYPVKNPSYAYNLEIYGDDDTCLECHIVCHLSRLAERTNGVSSLHVFLNDMNMNNTIDQIFSKFDIRRQSLHSRGNSSGNMAKRLLHEMTYQPHSRY